MVTQVIWMPKAEKTFNAIVDYWGTKGAFRAAEKFVNAVYDTIEKLEKYPEIGRPTMRDEHIRYINVSRFHQMFYQLEGQNLEILIFFDMRQNPKKRPY
jgi:plasmid stabilization system protein ParE